VALFHKVVLDTQPELGPEACVALFYKVVLDTHPKARVALFHKAVLDTQPNARIPLFSNTHLALCCSFPNDRIAPDVVIRRCGRVNTCQVVFCCQKVDRAI
jgi:hypothetical protein